MDNEELPLDRIICHDATKPFPLPDECIDVCITSPPYYGLRDYGKNVKSIFGGEINCEHEWIDEHKVKRGHPGDKSTLVGTQTASLSKAVGVVTTNFCSKCGCYDEKTELLTERGWIFFKDLNKNIKVATTINNTLKFVKPKNIFQYHYDGEMLRFFGQNIDLVVTPNHTMWAKKREFKYKGRTVKKKFEFISADKIKLHYKIKRNVKYKGIDKSIFNIPIVRDKRNRKKLNESKEVDMEVWCKFLGLYLAEGWSNKRKNKKSGGCEYTVNITQTKKRKEVESVLNRLPFKWNYVRNKDYVIYNKSLYYFFEKIGKVHTKFIPNEFKILDKKYLEKILEGIIIGDGHIRKDDGRKEICTTSKKLADDIQEIIIKCEKVSSITIHKDSRKNRRTLYRVPVIENQFETGISNIQRIEYNGSVFCCEVEPSHLLIIRRNGKIAICGNSWNGQLGLEPHPQMYIDHLVSICREIKRVLKKSGSFYLNLGDTYYGSGGASGDYNQGGLREGQPRYKQEKTQRSNWLQPKQLMGMPWRVAIALQEGAWMGKSISSQEEACWFAGLIDSDGVIGIYKSHDYNGLRIQVMVTDKETIEHICKITNSGKMYKHPRKTVADKSVYVWKCQGKTASNLLHDIYPYLICKKKQALVGWNFYLLQQQKDMEFEEGKKYGNEFGRPKMANKLKKKRSELADKCHKLNQREDVNCNGLLEPEHPIKGGGWILRNTIIWRKPNPMPSSVKDRLNNTFEHVFHFVRPDACSDWYLLGREPDKTKYHEKNILWHKIPDKFRSHPHHVDEIETGWLPCFTNLDYYYDLDGIRVPHKEGVIRWGGNKMKVPPKQKEQQGLAGALLNEERPWRNPKGKNPGDVLDVTTKGFKEAHFAVFPLNLIDQPLKATLPREVCRKCGKPRERIIEKVKHELTEKYNGKATKDYDSAKAQNPSDTKRRVLDSMRTENITVGWTDCGCNAGFDAGVVLDTFAGRGTVGKWCKENWGRYILFDIKPEYCEMAHLYIGGQKRKLIDGQTKLSN